MHRWSAAAQNGRHTYTSPKPKPEPERWSPETATAPMPKPGLLPLKLGVSGVLARTSCHYILTPIFHYPYSSVS